MSKEQSTRPGSTGERDDKHHPALQLMHAAIQGGKHQLKQTNKINPNGKCKVIPALEIKIRGHLRNIHMQL